jgi:hypothetical protein
MWLTEVRRSEITTAISRTLARTDLLVVRPKENEVSISEAHGDREIKQAQHATHSVLAKVCSVGFTIPVLTMFKSCRRIVQCSIPSEASRYRHPAQNTCCLLFRLSLCAYYPYCSLTTTYAWFPAAIVCMTLRECTGNSSGCLPQSFVCAACP